MGPRRETGEEDGLEGYSREKATEMVMNEREKFKMEQRRRQEAEEELKNPRQRCEEREDMWLQLFMTKDGGN